MKQKSYQYLSTNTKLKKDGILSWGIPAWKSQLTGLITCPGASKCIKGCYASQGLYVLPVVRAAQEKRLALSLSDAFIPVIDAEIKRRKSKVIRLHDSGDFYSKKYLQDWCQIMELNPNVKFYAYSKNVPIFDGVKLPDNFTLIWSQGGRYDAKVNYLKDKHSRVFRSVNELRAANYVDASQSDLNALGAVNKIGLIYHGAKSKEWVS